MEVIFAEFLAPLIFELLAEFGIRRLSQIIGLERLKSNFVPFIGYMLLAAIFALLSLYISNQFYIQNHTLQMINFIFTPILIGIIMKMKGNKLRKDERELTRLNQFWYGFAFALIFMLTRYLAISRYTSIS